jgi:hypothetical protein
LPSKISIVTHITCPWQNRIQLKKAVVFPHISASFNICNRYLKMKHSKIYILGL